MHEAVSDILVERAREADSLSQMMVLSVFAHSVLIALMILAPGSWRTAKAPDVTPMMITLGGVEGPDAGGKTPIAGKPVEEVSPPKPEVRPVAKAPEMVEPLTKAAPKTPPKPINKPEDKSRTQKPTTGAEIKSGAAAVNTRGAAIPFGGLSTGGGAPVQGAFTDYADFCCPSYLNQMVDLIKRNWNKDQGATGKVQMKFTIGRDGMLTGIQVEKPSDIPLLDLESQRALTKTQRLPPLPREFTEPTLTVHLIFEYLR